jgi:hypothetical protein
MADFDVKGFDTEARTIVERRNPIVLDFVRQATNGRHDGVLFARENEAAFRQAIHHLESTIDRAAYLQLAQHLVSTKR